MLQGGIFFAGALPDNPTVLDIVVYQFTGLIVVLGALTILYILLEVFGKLLHQSNAKAEHQTAKAQALAAAPPASTQVASGPEPQVVAAIAAAVAFVAGPQARIRSVTRSQGKHSNWAMEGRAAIHRSHRVR